MVWSGSVAPRSVSNDYVTVLEITYSTVHTHREVLAWPWVALRCMVLRAPPPESCGITTRHVLGQPREARIQRVHWCGCCASQAEWSHLQFLWFLEFSSSLPACTLSTMDSANSTHMRYSETAGVTNRISNPEFHLQMTLAPDWWPVCRFPLSPALVSLHILKGLVGILVGMSGSIHTHTVPLLVPLKPGGGPTCLQHPLRWQAREESCMNLRIGLEGLLPGLV